MYTPIDQNAIDQKIHSFMARKSPSRTFSMTLAERLIPTLKTDRQSSLSEIAYEPLEWEQGGGASRTAWQSVL